MKKKILPILIAIIVNSGMIAFGASHSDLEEVSLEKILEETPQAVSIESIEEVHEKTLSEKLHDVYHLEIEQIDKPSYLLKDVFTHKFEEDSLMESMQFWAAYYGDISAIMSDDGTATNHYDCSFINAAVDGKFKNDNADFRLMLNYSPFSHRNVM